MSLREAIRDQIHESEAWEVVVAELEKAKAKFPHFADSFAEASTVLTEEVGESLEEIVRLSDYLNGAGIRLGIAGGSVARETLDLKGLAIGQDVNEALNRIIEEAGQVGAVALRIIVAARRGRYLQPKAYTCK